MDVFVRQQPVRKLRFTHLHRLGYLLNMVQDTKARTASASFLLGLRVQGRPCPLPDLELSLPLTSKIGSILALSETEEDCTPEPLLNLLSPVDSPADDSPGYT